MASKMLKVIGKSSNIFDDIGESSENHWKSSKGAETFSKMPIMRWKSQAFDSEKVNRYKDLQKFIKFIIKVPFDPKTKKSWKQRSQKSEI